MHTFQDEQRHVGQNGLQRSAFGSASNNQTVVATNSRFYQEPSVPFYTRRKVNQTDRKALTPCLCELPTHN